MNEIIDSLLSEKIALEDENANLAKQLRESKECNRRITQRNNELRGKVLRLIRKNEELKQNLGEQVHNCINMEYQLDKIREIIKEDP